MFLVLSQSFRLFDVNLSLTGGGPGRETMGLALDIYTEGFRNNRMGYGGYTHSHYRTLENGEKVNWMDENLDPYTGEWLSRRILEDWEWQKDKGGYERGKDYNHSAYADLVISKIFGVEPQENGKIRIRPIFPDEWSYCSLEGIKCQGKDLSIIYDKTGEKYHQEKGFQVWCNEECIHKSLYPEKISF